MQGICPLTSDPAPWSWQSFPPSFNFRHLWPLKDLTLTTNQVRMWAHYLPRRGRSEPELGPQVCPGFRAALCLMVTGQKLHRRVREDMVGFLHCSDFPCG